MMPSVTGIRQVTVVFMWLSIAACVVASEEISDGARFKELGTLTLHLPLSSPLKAMNCSSSGAVCSLLQSPHPDDDSSSRNNISLVLVRSPVASSSSSSQDVQCYVARLRYSLDDAYHTSLSMHRLAHQALLDLQDRKHTADSALRDAGAGSGHLPKSSVLHTHQVHHRLRRLAQRRLEAAAASESRSVAPDDDDSQEETEDESAFGSLQHEKGSKDTQGVSSPPLLQALCLSAAVPVSPFPHPILFERSRRLASGDDRSLDCISTRSDDNDKQISFSSAVPRSATTPHREYQALGDLVVARYLRTNNWKFCRNVQHGVYFNVSAARHRQSMLPSDNEAARERRALFEEFRCLVAQHLEDVCIRIRYDRDQHKWNVTGGCASHDGAVFQYSSLKYGRSDAHDVHPKHGQERPHVWLPLSVRVCHDPWDEDTAHLRPSMEYTRRLALEAFESMHPEAMRNLETVSTSLDWRAATYEEGIPDSSKSGWSPFWGLLGLVGFFGVTITLVMCLL